MSSFYLDNAMAWAQFRLKGGWKNILTVGAGFSAIIIGVIALTYESMKTVTDRRESMTAWSFGLLILQCIILLLVGTMRLRASISADLTSRQIESHRLMPLQPFQAIVGYIAGGMAQLLALSLLTFAIGVGTCVLASLSLRMWLISNLLLLGFAVLAWSVTALTALTGRAAYWILVIAALICTFSQGYIFALAPASLMLCGPMVGDSIFNLSTPNYHLTTSLYLAVAAEMAMSLLFIAAAARKYAREDATPFPAWPALTLLGIWMGLSYYGVSRLPELLNRHMLHELVSDSTLPAMVGSLATSILLAMAVMASIARAKNIEQLSRHYGLPQRERRSIPFAFCLALCVAAVTLLAWFILPGRVEVLAGVVLADPRKKFLLPIAATCAISLTQAYVMMRRLYGRVRAANLIIGIFTLVLWIAPLGADVVYYAITQPDSSPHLDHFAPISPLGLLIQLITEPHPIGIEFGLLIQTALLSLWTTLWLFFKPKTPAPLIIPATSPALPPALAPQNP